MDFYRHAIYVIESRPELRDWLQGRVESEVVESLMKSVSYHYQEKIDDAWTEKDLLLKVKLVFLISLRSHAAFSNDTRLTATFETDIPCESWFDRWWTIRRFEAVQDLGWLEERLGSTRQPLDPTGSYTVDAWLADMRVRKPMTFGSVIFHRPGDLQISPLISGSWRRPPAQVLEDAGAAGSFGNQVDDACAAFVAWCLSKNPKPASIRVFNLPGVPSLGSEYDPFEVYEGIMAELATWKQPPFLVDLDEGLITHLGEVLWPPSKKGQKRPRDPSTLRSGSPFRWAWFGQELGDFRAGEHTYNCYADDSLPPVGVPLDGSFQWLMSARSHERNVAGNVTKTETSLASLLTENPNQLPAAFVEFFRSPSLWHKIRSCTGCFLHLDAASIPVYGVHGRLVRFLSDSQGCKHWHLHISTCGTKHTVVATYLFSGSEHGGKPYPKDITTCADSFEEFIWRFWLENELWFALNCQEPMPDGGVK
jgi:hypothetical protein